MWLVRRHKKQETGPTQSVFDFSCVVVSECLPPPLFVEIDAYSGLVVGRCLAKPGCCLAQLVGCGAPVAGHVDAAVGPVRQGAEVALVGVVVLRLDVGAVDQKVAQLPLDLL